MSSLFDKYIANSIINYMRVFVCGKNITKQKSSSVFIHLISSLKFIRF